MRTDKQVTQPSSFSNSPMSTVVTAKPRASTKAALLGRPELEMQHLRDRNGDNGQAAWFQQVSKLSDAGGVRAPPDPDVDGFIIRLDVRT